MCELQSSALNTRNRKLGGPNHFPCGQSMLGWS